MPENNVETVTVEIQVPLRIYLHGRRPIEETKQVVIEHLAIQAGVLFDFISKGSFLAENRDIAMIDYVEFCGVAGHLGKGLLEAISMTQDENGGEMAKASLPNSEVNQ